MLKIILIVAAVVAFSLAAFNASVPHIVLIPTGLALWAGSCLTSK